MPRLRDLTVACAELRTAHTSIPDVLLDVLDGLAPEAIVDGGHYGAATYYECAESIATEMPYARNDENATYTRLLHGAPDRFQG